MKEIINILKKYTNHNHIFLAQRGNKAILTALKLVKEANPKKHILVPDQGGFLRQVIALIWPPGVGRSSERPSGRPQEVL